MGTIGSQADQLEIYSPAPSGADFARLHQIYESLFVVDYEGVAQPHLALSAEPSADLMEWTVKLRPDVTLHNGKTFSAADVKQSLDYALDPAMGFVVSYALWMVDPTKIEVVDDLTVKIGTYTPYAFLPIALGSPVSLVAGWDGEEPVGTGMFTLDSFTPGQESTMVRFDDYWGLKPDFTNLQILTFEDQTALINALRGGQVDVAQQVPYTDAAGLKSSGFSILESATHDSPTIEFNVTNAPFDDPRVIEAMKLIPDRQLMLETAFAGFGTVGNDYVAHGDWCGAPDFPQRTQDIARAKQLLAEAGASNLTIEVTSTPVYAGVSELLAVFAQNAADAGVTVVQKEVDSAVYSENFGSYPAYTGTLIGDLLSNLSVAFLPGGPGYATGFVSDELATLAAELPLTLDVNRQCELIGQIQSIVHDEMPIIVPVFPSTLIAFSERVTGLQPSKDGEASFSYGGVSITG